MQTNNSLRCVQQIQEKIKEWKQQIVNIQEQEQKCINNVYFGYECALAKVIIDIENILYN